MVDVPQIDRDFRRILNSRRAMPEMTKMADRLFQKINEFHASLKDEQAKSQFRTDYRTLVETKFPLPPASSPTNQNSVD